LRLIFPCIVSITLKYKQQDATFSRCIYFYKLFCICSGSSSAHHQKYKTVHTALGIVRTILLPAAIVDEIELRSISSTIAASSSIGLTIPNAVRRILCSWWWAEKPPETCKQFIELNRSRKRCTFLVVV
jgi:hypothetical protein